MIQVDLKRRYLNGQQKLATCLAKKLQNVLNSDVARFTTHETNLSCSKSAYHQVALYENVLQKVESTFFYITICTYRAFTGPRQTFSIASDVPPVHSVIPT